MSIKFIDRRRESKEVKSKVIESIDSEIKAGGKTAVEMSELSDMRRKAALNGVDASDLLKVVSNIVIVTILVGFEMGHIVNQKGSRFLKVL